MAGEHLKYLDGWRGAAILSVLVGHFLAVPGINMGRVGVLLFFVLSGRLMAKILFLDRTPLKTFYLRRFSRIYPALLVFVSSTFGLFLAAHLLLGKALFVEPLNALFSALLVVNYYHVLGHNTAIYGHIWSLCVEEHSYLFLGLVAFVVAGRKRLSPAAIAAVAAVAMMVNGVALSLLGYEYYQVYTRTDVAAAAILASVAMFLWTRGRPFPTPFPLAALGLGLVVNLEVFPDVVKYTVGTICLAAAVATIDLAPKIVRDVLSVRVMTWFGTLSYSLYLWQQPFYRATEKLPPMLAPLLLLPAIGVALVSFHLVEQPARRFINGLAIARRPRTQEAPSKAT